MNNFPKYGLGILLLIFINQSAYSQIIEFSRTTDLIKAKKADTIHIDTDSAYVLSGKRADFLNEKLNELDTIKTMYSDQSENRKVLIQKIEELDGLILKLRSEFKNDSLIISQSLNEIIIDLNTISNDLRVNNDMLKTNNSELQKRVQRLQELINDLKKEMRGIWWNGITDKILAFSAGIATGIVLVLLL